MKRLLLTLITIVSFGAAYAQQKAYSATDLKALADGKSFKFTAQVAITPPDVSGTNTAISSDKTEDDHHTLSGQYYAHLTKDSVASYLPFYDKSKTTGGDDANINIAVVDDPGKSLATTFEYQVKQKKNGTVTVKITPDKGKVTEYVFTLSLDGSAKLEATVDNYKIMTYNGFYSN